MIRGTVLINRDICKGCELCIAACPQDSLGLSDQINRRGYRYVQLVQDNCTGCINCALVCPDCAITVYQEPKVKASQRDPFGKSIGAAVPAM